MIEHLMSLGLTEIESRCYQVLYEKDKQTGYEVSKKLGISRANVYASLASLVTKGAASLNDSSKPSVYSAIPIREFLSKKRMEFKQTSRVLKKEFSMMSVQPFDIRSVNGEEAVRELIMRCMASAEDVIDLNVSGKDKDYFTEIVQDLEDTVRIKFNEHYKDTFTIFIDQTQVLFGSLNNPAIMVTRHPVLVKELIETVNQ